MRIINKIFFFIFIFSFSISFCYANTINNIDMDIYIDKNGDAFVTEKWNAYLDEGTEGYRIFDLMGGSEITNFSVIDDSGKKYESLDTWNVFANFDEKAYRSGINKTRDSVELCFGISEYGRRKYVLNYTITDFVTQYTDTQGIYFNLIDLDLDVGNVDITVSSDIPFSLDNSKIWAFGNNGEIKFDDGNILMKSNGKLKDNQYMVLLVRFEDNIFSIDKTSKNSFNYIYNVAMDDISFKDKIDDYQEDNNVDFIFGSIFMLVLIFVVPIVCVLCFGKSNKKVLFIKRKHYDLYFGVNGKQLPRRDDIAYFRDIPCNKSLSYAYWLCFHYDLVSIDDLREGFIGAMLLKWVRDGKIKIIEEKKNEYVIHFNDFNNVSDYVEYELYKMFMDASSDGKTVKGNEFEKWCSNNIEILTTWFFNINGYANMELERLGLITNRLEDTTTGYGDSKKQLSKNVDVRVKEEAIRLKGLKKYLEDFTLIPEKKYMDVHLWNEYLIFAMLLGIADKVEKQFSELYPEFVDVSVLCDNTVNYFVKSISYVSYKSYKTAVNASRYSSVRYSAVASGNYHSSYSGSSRSSGGGGSSYRGGGSSSRGSRGGRFR